MKKRFKSEKIHKALMKYKSKSNEENLHSLYEELDFIINQVTKNIARSFSRKHPDAFEDIRQNIKIEIYNRLEKLARLSIDGENLVCILVSATCLIFNTYYRKWERDTPYDSLVDASKASEEFHPISGMMEVGINDIDPTHIDEEDQVYSKAIVWSKPIVEEKLKLQDFLRIVQVEAVALSNFENKELIEFCVNSLLSGRQPSLAIIQKLWKVEDPGFWPSYALVLIRLAILKAKRSL